MPPCYFAKGAFLLPKRGVPFRETVRPDGRDAAMPRLYAFSYFSVASISLKSIPGRKAPLGLRMSEEWKAFGDFPAQLAERQFLAVFCLRVPFFRRGGVLASSKVSFSLDISPQRVFFAEG
jgi:hypothetical protein